MDATTDKTNNSVSVLVFCSCFYCASVGRVLGVRFLFDDGRAGLRGVDEKVVSLLAGPSRAFYNFKYRFSGKQPPYLLTSNYTYPTTPITMVIYAYKTT